MVSAVRQALIERSKKQNSERVVKGVPPPLAPEVNYRRELLGLQQEIDSAVEQQIFPLLTYYQPKYIQDTPRQDVLKQVDNIINSLFAPVDRFAKIAASTFVIDVNEVNRERLYQSFQKSFGFSVSTLLKNENIVKPVDAAIDENIKLIKTIPTESLERVKNIISAGMTKGETAGDIRNQLREDFGISERRIRVIARDQTSKINGNLTRIRALEVGSDTYFWIGRNDALERPTHKVNNGKIFSWHKAPATGHPGEDYQCRCYGKLIIKF